MGKPSPIGLLGIYTNDPSGPRCQTTDFTNRSWAELVLRYLNEFAFPPLIGPPEAPIPVTTNNINNLTIWMNNENNINNSQSWWLRNNPLNNSLASKAYGLGPYADLDVAAYWAAMEIRRFPTIVAALDNDASSAAFSAAVIQSGWACSHYGVKAAGSDNCTEGNHIHGSPYQHQAPNGYWTAGTPTPPDAPAKWWGDGVPPRGLDFLVQSVPREVTAPATAGTNPNAIFDVGWDWDTPQAWQPKQDISFPGEPNMSAVPPDFVSIDPTNPATYNSTTGFGQKPPSGGGGTTGSITGGATGSVTGGTTGSITGGTTGSITGGTDTDGTDSSTTGGTDSTETGGPDVQNVNLGGAGTGSGLKS